MHGSDNPSTHYPTEQWTANSVKVELRGSKIVFIAPCGESRWMTVVEAKRIQQKIRAAIQSFDEEKLP